MSAASVTVGLAREAPEDRRVALRPVDVAGLIECGATILVERGVGLALGFTDQDYRQAGADVAEAVDVWGHSDVIVKYKAPTQSQRALSTRPQTILAIMHPEADHGLVEWLLNGGHVGLSLEYYERDGVRSVSSITGRIAGEMAFLYGAFHAQAQFGGSGRLITGDRSDPGRVVVIGHGNVGGTAVHAALRNGCAVTVAGRSAERAEEFRAAGGLRVQAIASLGAEFETALADADLVIGAILISTFDTPPIVTERMVAEMRPGAVIVDATAGYGAGYLATMPPDRTDPPPITTAHGVVHIKVDRYPALVPATTVREVTHEFRAAVAEYLDGGMSGALRSALVVTEGRIVNDEVQRHWNHWRRP